MIDFGLLTWTHVLNSIFEQLLDDIASRFWGIQFGRNDQLWVCIVPSLSFSLSKNLAFPFHWRDNHFSANQDAVNNVLNFSAISMYWRDSCAKISLDTTASKKNIMYKLYKNLVYSQFLQLWKPGSVTFSVSLYVFVSKSLKCSAPSLSMEKEVKKIRIPRLSASFHLSLFI